MTSSIFVESAHARVHKPRVSARRAGRQLRPVASLTLILLLSLGLWWAIWTVFSALLLG